MTTLGKLLFLVTITHIAASTDFNCTFEEDLCGWTQATDDDFDWKRHSGIASITISGPATDHTLGTSGGFYMYTNSKDYRLDQKARLVSPVVTITGQQQKCFHFFYLMHGAEVGTLDVYTSSTNGTRFNPVWSRVGTQGIFYLLGQVTVNTTSMVIVEGSGSSGNQGDIAIDDVSIVDGACTSVGANNSISSLACDFELEDICGYTNAQGNYMNWSRNVGLGIAAVSLDHTTRTAGGAFMAISGYVNWHGALRSIKVTAQGLYCMSFFYRQHGANVGMLSVSLVDSIENSVTQLWMVEVNIPVDQWDKAQISLNISSVVQVSFDAIMSGEAGSLSIDDISITNGTCETPPNCSFDQYDLCSWRNDLTHDDFDWEVANPDSDAQILSPWRDADKNEHGGFILLDMARNPNKEQAYLVGEVIPSDDIQCFSFYYYPLTWGSESGDMSASLNIYISIGNDFPGTLTWSYSLDKSATTFTLGQMPIRMQRVYRLIIGGFVTVGQVLALDKFSLTTSNCSYLPAKAQPAAPVTSTLPTAASTKHSSPSPSTGPHSLWDCDFETDTCNWSVETTDSWSRQQAGVDENGPHFDHTKGPGGHGYFLTLGTTGGEVHTLNALKNQTSYCFTFWIYLYGSANFEFKVQTVGDISAVLFYKHNSMGTEWHPVVLDIPSVPASFDIQLLYVQLSSGNQNQLAIDDIQVSEGNCSLEVGPNCTFDRGWCNWGNAEASIWEDTEPRNFNFTLSSGSDQDDGTIQSDHTTETYLGSFIKATVANHKEGQQAQFQSPHLRFNDSVCLRFYYFVTPSCDSSLSIGTLGPQERHPVPLLDLQDIIYGAWQSTEVTVYDPFDLQIIFLVTIGHNKSGEIGIDDVAFTDGECPYRGTTDFENGFDVFHNVYSNDFNWVIASPSDGIFAWLPATDFSSNSENGHFAVISFNFSRSAGSKVELWGPLSPEIYDYCTTFSFFVHGSDPGMLNVTFVDFLEKSRVVVWSYTPTPASKDSRIDAQFPHVYASKFYVVFTAILGSDGGWALDSIETFPAPSLTCRVLPAQAAASTIVPPTEPTLQTVTYAFSHQKFAECDFAENLCNWSIADYSDFSWNRTSGDKNLPFAPLQGRPGSGDKFFLTLPKFTPGKSAILQSPSFNEQAPGSYNSGQFEFRLWLNIQGEHTGRFVVGMATSSLSDTIFYRDQPTNSWEQIEFSVSVDGPFSLTMEGVRGSYDEDSISIDDIEVSNTAGVDDNNIYKCSFETSFFCGFKQDGTAALHWWYRGGDQDTILQDHTTMTNTGHVAAVSQSEGKPGEIARLTSPTIQPMSGCLTLWLWMTSDGDEFRVYISSDSQEELLLQNENTQGAVWVKREAPVSSNDPFTIILEAEVLGARTADLILDDFQLTNSICDTKGACSFERDMCTWQNSLISGADFYWIRGTGNSVGVTGPAVDSTIGSSDGYYMYIDSSGPYHYQDKAWLDSEAFPMGTQCLHFHYYMSGSSVGTLNVYTLLLDSVNSVQVWSLSGDQGSGWKSALVTVGSRLVNYNVRFEGVLGFSVTSDIAIDDIMFMPDPCDIQPLAAKVIETMATPTTPTGNQSTPVIIEKCDFDDVAVCGFHKGVSDNIWVLASADMPVSNTLKPFNGHTSNSTNGFIYAQVGNQLTENATARIISPVFAAKDGEQKCLEFYYHMNGEQVGQLNVYIAPDGQQDSLTNNMRLWSQDFDAGPGWKKAHVPILVSTDYHVVFEAIRSKVDYYYGIDDLTVYDNECEPENSCDFDEDVCLWSNEGGDSDSKFYWTRYRSYDRTARFAPAVDHTRQSVTGYYMFVQASLDSAGSVARLYSQVFASSSSSYCFNFWYYMFGNNLGQLKVFVRNSISSSSVYNEADLWELDGPTNDGWNLAQVNISRDYTRKPFVVVIEATVGSTLQGAFGVDDTEFDLSDCGTRPSAAIVTADVLMLPDCNFDDGTMCDWSVVGSWKYTFVVTETGGAIPFDHNGGSGQYLLADSRTYPQNTSVSIQSPLLPPTLGANCLTLWYNMAVGGMSSLSLLMITGSSDVVLWKAYTERSSQWLPLRINIQSDFDYKLMLTAVVGSANAGSVAIDDITVIHGACPRSEIIDFEEDLSGFIPEVSFNIHWMWKMARDSFTPFDHTYHTSQGHLLQADLGGTTAALKTAVVQSPLYPSVGDECMEFWYTKEGSSGGWLSVQISQSQPGHVANGSSPLWLTTADTNGNWTRVLLDITTDYPYWIIFQAAANNSRANDVIAIDDISFTTDPCPSAVSCDFDVNNCGYVTRSNTSVYWQVTKGAYTDSFMPVDQTLHSPEGMYMEADFPGSLTTYATDLVSPVEKQTSNKCLTFWYYAMGQGSLQVFAEVSQDQRQSLAIVTISPTQEMAWWFRSWSQIQVDVNTTVPYSIVFQATSWDSPTSIVLDSVSLLNGTCASQISNPTTSTQASTDLDPKKAMLGCDFENSNFCNFTNGSSSRTFHWQLFSLNSKHNAGTGVDFDHTKYNKYGHHVYMDTSGQKFNATAQLASPTFISDQHMCLSFYYAMYGRDVNRQNVYVTQGQTRKLYWTLSGNQGEGWHHQTVEIGQSPQPTQVIFEGVVGVSDEGDIDLDDIWIFHGSCPPPDFCDFEDSEMCKMDQDNLDDADWIIQSAALAAGSDPKTDHTYGTNQGHYLMVNMSNTDSGNEARILTRQYSADSARCLSFWFHFNNPPDNSHSLTVTLQDERGVGINLIVLRGFFQDDWTPAVFPLQPADNFQVVFDGQSGGSGGSIAVDDIRVSPNECESYIDCDFESQDMCGWKTVAEYSTPAWELIPPHHYMTLNFSKMPSKSIQVSKVQSLIIPPGLDNSFCLTFDYMMYGDNVGYLNVSMQVEYPEAQSIIIFSTHGDQGSDSWQHAHADSPQIDSIVSRFVITGTTAETSSNAVNAVILIANILLFPHPCSQWLQQEDANFTCSAQVTIPSSSVCDFMTDCPGSVDELNCGSCDFESGYCNWDDATEEPALTFAVVSDIPIAVFNDAHPGHFLTLERTYSVHTGNADLVQTQELGPSPNNCSLTFSYYMSLDSQSIYGNLFVSVEENNEETVVWESTAVNSSNWQTASVDIGGIHSRFKIHFALQYLPFDNAVGLDDIKLSGCSFADIYSGTCPGLLTCLRTGACIDNPDKFCDFTDNCGDSTDEDPEFCREYLMDDFEESFGDWSQDDKDDFDWSRHSGNWVSTGPRRDHTLGTHFGHYLIFEGATHTEGQIARLVSPEFIPTQGSDCKIRFYYYMHSANKGQLTVYVRSKISGDMQQIDQYMTTLQDSWLFGSSALTSNEIFQVVFEGKVVGQHSADIGLDDITFTPQCYLGNPSTLIPGTTKLVSTTKSNVATTQPGMATSHGATTQIRIATTNHGPTTKTGVITNHGATTKTLISTSHRTASKPGMTTIVSATTEYTVTFKSHATSEHTATGTLPNEAGTAANSASSDSWRVPVGVVLGLLALVTATVGAVVYFKRTGRLRWVKLPSLKKNTEAGDINPLCELDVRS